MNKCIIILIAFISINIANAGFTQGSVEKLGKIIKVNSQKKTITVKLNSGKNIIIKDKNSLYQLKEPISNFKGIQAGKLVVVKTTQK